MWLAICILTGFFIAGSSPDPGWNPGQKYEYIVRTRSLASNNEVGNQYVGVVSQAEAEMALDRRNPKQLNVRIKNARFAQVHAWLSGGWDSPLTGDNKPNWQELKLQHPYFAVLLNQSVITALIVNRRTSINEANFYRSIASQLIVNMKPIQRAHLTRQQKPLDDKTHAYYSVMEDSLYGKCKTLFDRSQITSDEDLECTSNCLTGNRSSHATLMKILKSTDFTNCEIQVTHHNGVNPKTQKGKGEDVPGGSLMRSSSSKIILRGTTENYSLISSITINRIEAYNSLHNDQSPSVNSKINVTLEKVEGGNVEAPSDLERRSIHFQIILEPRSGETVHGNFPSQISHISRKKNGHLRPKSNTDKKLFQKVWTENSNNSTKNKTVSFLVEGDCTYGRIALIKKDDGKLYCFSKRVLRVCDPPCSPTSRIPVMVDFYCIGKSATADYWESQLQKGGKINFSDRPTTESIQMLVPVSCG